MARMALGPMEVLQTGCLQLLVLQVEGVVVETYGPELTSDGLQPAMVRLWNALGVDEQTLAADTWPAVVAERLAARGSDHGFTAEAMEQINAAALRTDALRKLLGVS